MRCSGLFSMGGYKYKGASRYESNSPSRNIVIYLAISVMRGVLLVGRAKLDCLEGGTHEETLRPQVNPKVECQRFRETKVLSRLLKDPRNTLDCVERE